MQWDVIPGRAVRGRHIQHNMTSNDSNGPKQTHVSQKNPLQESVHFIHSVTNSKRLFEDSSSSEHFFRRDSFKVQLTNKLSKKENPEREQKIEPPQEGLIVMVVLRYLIF